MARSDLDDRVAQFESQGAIVDRRLRTPARWRGVLRREARGRPALDERVRVAETFNRMAAAPKDAFRIDGLLRLHEQVAGGGVFRSGVVRVGRSEVPHVPCAPARAVPALVAEALDRAGSGRERAPLAAARLHLDLALIHPFDDGNGRVARLAASAVLLAAGSRSTLVTSVEQAFHHEPERYGQSFTRLAVDGDADAWLGRWLDAMCAHTDAIARFRAREERLRSALAGAGVDPADQDGILLTFDSDERLDDLDRPVLDALLAASAPWPALAPAWGPVADRLDRQLRRLRAEEHDDRTRANGATTRRSPHAANGASPIASVVIPAYRDADTIVQVLRGLERQDLAEPFETIVVASGPDSTADIVRRAFPGVVLLSTADRLTPGAARNAGTAVAQGEVVAYVAADCIPAPDWLRRRVHAHRAGFPLVGGFIDSARPSTMAGWAQYFAKFGGMQAMHDRRHEGRGPLFHLSYARAVLGHPWEESTIAGEDTAFNDGLVRAGFRVWYDGAIRVQHCNTRRLADVLSEQREQGAAAGALCRNGGLGEYFAPMRRGPWAPIAQSTRGLVATARFRPRLLGRCLLAFPLTTRAIAARRRAFRAARVGTGPSVPDALSPRVVHRRVPGHATPDVSVIVPAYNEAAVIARCIDSLLAQTIDAIEIIVVDDGSGDRTAEIADSRGVTVVRTQHEGPAAAKNAGAARARGEVLVFFDADLVAEPDAIERLCRPILAGATVGTFTSGITVANPEAPWADCWTLNRGAARGQHFARQPPARWANFRAVAHEPFLAVGGFDDVGYGEDMTLAPKLGTLAHDVPEARVRHHHPDSLGEIWRNARWVGRGAVLRSEPRAVVRYLPWRSLRRGIAGARRIGRPRFVLFAVVYDFGVLTSYVEMRLGRRRHAK